MSGSRCLSKMGDLGLFSRSPRWPWKLAYNYVFSIFMKLYSSAVYDGVYQENIKYVQLGPIDLEFKVKKARVSDSNFTCVFAQCW